MFIFLSFKAVQNNGSIFLHVYVTKHGKSPKNSEFSTYNVRQLNKFKRRRYMKTKNLLTGETSATPEEVLVNALKLHAFLT